jgi:hypothetical protein
MAVAGMPWQEWSGGPPWGEMPHIQLRGVDDIKIRTWSGPG